MRRFFRSLLAKKRYLYYVLAVPALWLLKNMGADIVVAKVQDLAREFAIVDHAIRGFSAAVAWLSIHPISGSVVVAASIVSVCALVSAAQTINPLIDHRAQAPAPSPAVYREPIYQPTYIIKESPPAPNLQCGKIEFLAFYSTDYQIFVDERGSSGGAILTLENQIPASNVIAPVHNVTAEIRLYSTEDKLLAIAERGVWTNSRMATADFRVGAMNHLVLFFHEAKGQPPQLLDRAHDRFITHNVPQDGSELLVTLNSPQPIYQKRFHIKLRPDIGPKECSDKSCDFCKRFIFNLGGG